MGRRAIISAVCLIAAIQGAAFAQPQALQRDSARDCAVCHLEWVDAFEKPESILLIDPPAEPVVAESETCLGCHDGSIADSRRRVWIEHGHKTDIVPPESVKVPAFLPLKNGKITCRTCHTAHAGTGPETVATAVFLRVPNDTSQLCQSCHPQYAKGPELGTHPVGGMPWPVPEELTAAGAHTGPDKYRLICQTCHTPHGSREESLLVMGTDSSQLCLTCHKKLRPGMWLPEEQREHPQNPPLENDAQRQAIKDMGTKTGPGETLICLSCHKLHHGLAGRKMLADRLTDSNLCVRCHPQRKEMFDSKHDLRVTAPTERNRLGQRPEESGPCGACHSFHQFARRPEPERRDPTGLCVTCHKKGQCAEKAGALTFSHPSDVPPERVSPDNPITLYPDPRDKSRKELACLSCHDPHEVTHASFLRVSPDETCGKCHGQEVKTLAGGHDLTTRPAVANAKGESGKEARKCGFCHGIHDTSGPVLWAATKDNPDTPDELCTECHRDGGIAANTAAMRFGHPTGPKTAEPLKDLTPKLPLYDEHCRRTKDGFVTCSSCHDPHADSGRTPNLVRGGPPPTQLCIECHPDRVAMFGGMHDLLKDPQDWPDVARNTNDRCGACHLPHGDDPTRQAWTVKPLPGYDPADGACLACHRHTEWESHGGMGPGATRHPRVADTQPADHGLPLVPTAPGRTSGAIGCKTCHNPHGGPGGPPHILREGKGSLDPSAMCMRCHEEVQYIGMSMHSKEALGTEAGRESVCGPCHVVHAKEGAATQAAATRRMPGIGPPDVRRCTVCHGHGGGATEIDPFEHPAVALRNTVGPGSPGFMPLINERGAIDTYGRVACVTCHMPHGRPPTEGFPAVDPKKIGEEQLRAMMPMLRPYTAPNLCSSCHGLDGIRRFLYYHHPEKRRAVTQPGGAGTTNRR